MKLPLHISLDTTLDALETRLRAVIRLDTGIEPKTHAISIIIFSHPASGAVAYMYGAQYAAHSARFEVVLNQMGWEWERTFQAPTRHAAKLRSVP